MPIDPYAETDEEKKANRGPAPTSYVNFQRYFGANKDAATRQAEKLAQKAAGAAGAAEDALNTSQTQFAKGVRTGTVEAVPQGVTYEPAKTNTGPASNKGALTGEATRPDGSGGLTAEQMKANSEKMYTGPGGLAEVEGFKSAQEKATAAEGQLNALTSTGGIQGAIQKSNPYSSNSAFSSSLEGSAGRSEFDKLRAQFDPQKALAKAQLAAGKTALEALETSGKNAEDWASAAGIQGTKEEKTKAWEAARAAAKATDAATAKTVKDKEPPPDYHDAANIFYNIDVKDPVARKKRQDEWDNFMKAAKTDTKDDINLLWDEFNSVMSPINWATDALGQKDPMHKYGTSTFHGQAGAASGSTSGQPIPWGKAGLAVSFWVWRQMTPEQWAVLDQKPPTGNSGQAAWIGRRYNELVAEASERNAAGTKAYGSKKA